MPLDCANIRILKMFKYHILIRIIYKIRNCKNKESQLIFIHLYIFSINQLHLA